MSEDKPQYKSPKRSLALDAVVGRWSEAKIAAGLQRTPIKVVKRWCEENIGASLQAKRRQAYDLACVTKPAGAKPTSTPI